MSETADVLFYVQHLLGTGHLRRAAVIARALDAAGLRVLFVSGGLPADDLDVGAARVLQLPALMSRDESFSALVDAEGLEVDETWKRDRAAQLLAAFRDARPGVLITEMFPFGRRQMRFELLPLLEAARAAEPPPAIVCSVRDILNLRRRPERTAWILDTLARSFDRVLVHGDPDLLPFETTFPEARRIVPPLDYTGYVVAGPPDCGPPDGGPPGPGEAANGHDEVIVSAGAGRVAVPLIEAAFAARALGPLAEARWRVLVGPNMPEDDYRGFLERAPQGMTVERARPDFQALLSREETAGQHSERQTNVARWPQPIMQFRAWTEVGG